MAEPTVLSLEATAVLDRSGDAVAAARRRAQDGDEDDTWVVRELEAGRLLPAALIVVATVLDEYERERRVDCLNRGLWLELRSPPEVERDVAEITPKDYDGIADSLRAEGMDVDARELAEMYVHVELDEPLRAELLERARR
jgi:hypothetical protein